MKTLQKIADKYGLTLVPIKYKCQGIPLKRKGYDLIGKDNTIYLSFEPKDRSWCKWMMIDKTKGCIHYTQSLLTIGKILEEEGFNPTGTTGYYLEQRQH